MRVFPSPTIPPTNPRQSSKGRPELPGGVNQHCSTYFGEALLIYSS